MSRGFFFLLLGSSAAVFAGTWMATGEAPRAESAAPAAAASASVSVSSCEEAQAKGLGPFYAGQPGYREELDPDGDGLACPPS